MSAPARRTTRQRTAVAELLERQGAFLSAQQLHELLRAEGVPVGLTTVYRNLQALVDDGAVDAVRREGEVVYRRCAMTGHHHHLVCRGCGRSVEVEGPEVETWAEAVGRAHGFGDVEHTVEVFGTCPACRGA